MASTSESSIKDSYILNRDFFVTTRLNCQHWIWHQELGHNIHPTIPIPPHARIAYVATGTCAWLQWDEIDVSDSTIIHTGDDGDECTCKTNAVQQMAHLMKEQGSWNWIIKLPTVTQEEAIELTEAALYRVKPERCFSKQYTDMLSGSWVEITETQEVGSERRKEFEELVRDVREETRAKAAFEVVKVVNEGRKGG